MKQLRKALFLPVNVYELVRREADKNNRTMVAEIQVRFTKKAKRSTLSSGV